MAFRIAVWGNARCSWGETWGVERFLGPDVACSRVGLMRARV